MSNFRIEYSHPWLLLAIIPILLLAFIPHFITPKKYRRTRNRIISLVMFLVASILSVNLLAGVSFAYETPNIKNEVIILVDVSESGDTARADKDSFVKSIINVADGEYNVGVVKFGYDQKYVAELSSNPEELLTKYIESDDPDTSASDIASALEYAKGLFSYPESGKIVLLSDGVETDGEALSVIKTVAAQGIKVDTVHFPTNDVSDVQILSVMIPDRHFTVGAPFQIDMYIKTNADLTTELPVSLKFTDNGKVVGESELTITSNEMHIPLEITLDERGMHELGFEIECKSDSIVKNNYYHTFVNIQEFNKILLIEKYDGESAALKAVFGDNYDVTTLSIQNHSSEIPRDIETLAEYEQVILVNIAYSDMPGGFEELLHRYVYDLGGGLFTVGGINDGTVTKPIPHAYNREDLERSTYYKQMLPVSAINFTPPVAVMIVVDASGSMAEEVGGEKKYHLALDGAEACLDALSTRDFCGIMTFDKSSSERLQIIPVSQKDRILDTIDSLRDKQDMGDTVFTDAILSAGKALSVIDNVEKKHIIMVTDGKPSDRLETYGAYIEENMSKGITMSIITVGGITDSDKNAMDETAAVGGGKHHNVTDYKSIPSIMQQDLALEAIAEIAYGEEFNLTIKDRTNVVVGMDDDLLPTLSGYYGTVKKEGALVPLMGKYVPIYAEWKYGAGNVGSFMCDLNGEWSKNFLDDIVGQAIILNIVDNIFPTRDVRADGIEYIVKTDNYNTQLTVHGVPEGQRVEVEVKPLSDSLVDLMEKGIPVTVAEGNRRFSFVIRDTGLYEIVIRRYDEYEALVSEFSVYKSFSYSEEYNLFTDRAPIGAELIKLIAEDGKGNKIEDAAEVFSGFDKTVKIKYDPRVILLIIAIVAVLIDVAVRKFKFKWPHELIREYKIKKADEAKKKA